MQSSRLAGQIGCKRGVGEAEGPSGSPSREDWIAGAAGRYSGNNRGDRRRTPLARSAWGNPHERGKGKAQEQPGGATRQEARRPTQRGRRSGRPGRRTSRTGRFQPRKATCQAGPERCRGAETGGRQLPQRDSQESAAKWPHEETEPLFHRAKGSARLGAKEAIPGARAARLNGRQAGESP